MSGLFVCKRLDLGGVAEVLTKERVFIRLLLWDNGCCCSGEEESKEALPKTGPDSPSVNTPIAPANIAAWWMELDGSMVGLFVYCQVHHQRSVKKCKELQHYLATYELQAHDLAAREPSRASFEARGPSFVKMGTVQAARKPLTLTR